MLEQIGRRIEIGTELTQSEFELIKQLIKRCTVGYAITKTQKRNSKIALGEKTSQPVNPLTAYEYGFEAGYDLNQIVKEKNWCGQFAGRSQWDTMGRSVIAGEEPALSYMSIYKKPINLYAYEQTIEQD